MRIPPPHFPPSPLSEDRIVERVTEVVSARMAVQIEEALTKVLDAQTQAHGPLLKSIQLLTERQAKFELALQRIQDSASLSSDSPPKKPKHHPYHA